MRQWLMVEKFINNNSRFLRRHLSTPNCSHSRHAMDSPREFCNRADVVFLDPPQPWLSIPFAASTLKADGLVCSFSPCIEKVQRPCETFRSTYTCKIWGYLLPLAIPGFHQLLHIKIETFIKYNF